MGSSVSSLLQSNDGTTAAARSMTIEGERLLNTNDFEGAIAKLSHAIACQPTFAYALYCRGFALYRLNLLEQALLDFDRAIELDASFAYSFNRRGCTLLRLHRLQQALLDFDRAVELQPALANAHFSRACVCLKLNHREQALASFRQLLALDNGSSGLGSLGLGMVLAHDPSQWQEAIDHLLAAEEKLSLLLQSDPNDAWVSLRRAQARRYIALLDPASQTWFAWLRQARSRTELLKQAAADLEQPVAFRPSHTSALIERGLVHAASGRNEEALGDLDAVITVIPQRTRDLSAGATHE